MRSLLCQRPKIKTQIDRTGGLPKRAQGVHGLNGPKSWALTHFEVIIIILWDSQLERISQRMTRENHRSFRPLSFEHPRRQSLETLQSFVQTES
jgi:hypothetical protein